MADMVLGSAQGAVGSLLRRLTFALSEEAQMLGRVRADVQFIKDEMESMHSFLLCMVENSNDSEGEDHQVRAWTKQVAEVAYTSQNCVDIYVQNLGTRAGEQGLLDFLRQLPQLLWTLPAATALPRRSESSRSGLVRSGRDGSGMVSKPLVESASKALWHGAEEDEDTKDQEDARRRALAEAELVPFESFSLIQWMTTNLPCVDDGREKTENSVRHSQCQCERMQCTKIHGPSNCDVAYKQDSSKADEKSAIREIAHGRSPGGLVDRREETKNSSRDPLPRVFDGKEKYQNSGRVPTSWGPRENKWERIQRLKDQEASNWSHSRSFQLKEVEDHETDDDEDEFYDFDDNEEDEFYDFFDGSEGRGEESVTPKPRVIVLEEDAGSEAAQFVKKAYEDPRVVTSCSLDCRVWIQLGPEYPPGPSTLLRDILANLPVGQMDARDKWNHEQLVEKLQLHLNGKRFLIVLEDVTGTSLWDGIRPAFPEGKCSPGSALIVTTRSREAANSFLPYKVYEKLKLDSEQRGYLANCYSKQAIDLVSRYPATKRRRRQWRRLHSILRDILRDMAFQTENCRFFLAALYANPNQTLESFLSLRKNLKNYSSSKNKKLVLMFAYDSLSSNCKNCLLYLSIFPEHTTFQRARFVRRCVAEGMITKRGRMNALNEADHCLNVLVANRFVVPIDTDVTGKVKRFGMNDFAHDFITEIASNENFSKTILPPDLACCLPIRNAVQQQHITQVLNVTRSETCWNICTHFGQRNQTKIEESNATIVFLESLPSTNLGLLEVLDLEDCKELKNHHLKNICSCAFQLKYLSLRNTEITKLPKQINKLCYLETLDIRQTKVRVFAKNSGMLPNLKHLLAGQTDYRSHAEEPFLTVQMPKCVGVMAELQVLSHVAVSGSGNILNDISNLLHLRKLGLVLSGCRKPIFRHLYHAIGNLSRSLRILSIQIIPNSENGDADTGNEDTLLMPPKYLRKLNISGLANGLPQWVKDLKELTKITLHKTLLTADDIEILGKLTSLSYLWLRQESCSERTVTFRKDRFQSLKFLVIHCAHITNINFDDEATSKLKKIVWSSIGDKLSLSGIDHLQSLKELELSGNFNLQRVKQAIAANQNSPILKTDSNAA